MKDRLPMLDCDMDALLGLIMIDRQTDADLSQLANFLGSFYLRPLQAHSRACCPSCGHPAEGSSASSLLLF